MAYNCENQRIIENCNLPVVIKSVSEARKMRVCKKHMEMLKKRQKKAGEM